MSDGRLVPVTPRTWRGTLHGYRVEVFRVPGGQPDGGESWHAAVIRGGYTAVVLPAASLADGGRRAREWIERQSMAVPADLVRPASP